MFWIFLTSILTIWINRFCLTFMSWSWFFLDPKKHLAHLNGPSEIFAKPRSKTNRAKIHHNQEQCISAETFFLLIQKLLTCSRGARYITRESLISHHKSQTILSLHQVSACEGNSVEKKNQFLSPEWKKEEKQTLFFKYCTCKKEHFVKYSYILDSTAIPIWQHWYITSDFLWLCLTSKSTAWLCVKHTWFLIILMLFSASKFFFCCS